MNKKTGSSSLRLIVLYEFEHANELARRLHSGTAKLDGTIVLALDLGIEKKLHELNIPYVSGRIHKRISVSLLHDEDDIIKSYFADSLWSSFTYLGVALHKTFEFVFRSYMQRVLYYSDILISAIEEQNGIAQIQIFESQGGFIREVAGLLAHREVNVVVDCAKELCAQYSIPLEVLPITNTRFEKRNTIALITFSIKRKIFAGTLFIWNLIISTALRPRHPRVLVSDYWRNVSSTVELFKRGEFIFIDRTEILQIPLRNLFKYRMQFVHSENYLSHSGHERVKIESQRFLNQWKETRSQIPDACHVSGKSLHKLMLGALDDIFFNIERTIREIEGTYLLYEKIKPDVILLRASVSGQIHFSVLPLLARNKGIPSVELQHGLEYLGPGSWSRQHAAEFLAVYGPLIKSEFVTLGYSSDKIRNIGSPRFDLYANAGPGRDTSSYTILCIAPDIRQHVLYDSYSAQDYFNAVAGAIKKIQNAKIIIKLRSGPAGEVILRDIVEKAFSGSNYRIAQEETLSNLLEQSDTVVSCYSTAVLEALQSGSPVIIPALNRLEEQVVEYHFSRYRDGGAISIAYSQSDMEKEFMELSNIKTRQLRAENGAKFLAENYCFDGGSSRRCAELITNLAETRGIGKVA